MAADKRDEPKEEAAESQEAKPKSKKMLFIIIGAVVVLIVVGVVLFMVLGKKSAPTDGEAADAQEQTDERRHLASFELEPIIVNLSENASFLKVKILVEYDVDMLARATARAEHGGSGEGGGHAASEGEGGAGSPAIFEERLPIIKDAVIRVLSSKKADDVLTSEGKDHLKEELVEAINQALGLDEAPVTNVYFSDFIVQ